MPYSTINLQTLRARIRALVGIAAQFSDSEVDSSIREALRVWNFSTGGYWLGAGAAVSSVATQAFYSLPSQIIIPKRVTWNGTPLSLSSLKAQDRINTLWQSQPGTPIEWFPLGWTLFGIAPPDAGSSNSILVEGVLNAPQPVNNGDPVDIDPSDILALSKWCHFFLSIKLSGAELREAVKVHLPDFFEGARTTTTIVAVR